MVKEPRAGRVKTRLGRDIGMVSAAWWFRHSVDRLLRNVSDPRWDLLLAVSPDAEGLRSRVWPEHLQRIPQRRGDLGQRMAHLLALPQKGPVVIIGGDIPGVRRHHIADAFAKLGSNRAVFGPATDGGYWLVGLKRTTPPPRQMFKSVRWSTEHALADTLATMPGYAPAYAATLQDVNTAADLAAYQA
ncbi:TIGR04282 family arsenosugar biosynthesis glycosyltransferase [Profundibacter sp.]|uniref:TIGR04282 family arsenosugar biosynthesis glycosyltransferase n=1 Tax=Profundibacter sp. TaxID=3101071 RepID=UPI003D0E2336